MPWFSVPQEFSIFHFVGLPSLISTPAMVMAWVGRLSWVAKRWALSMVNFTPNRASRSYRSKSMTPALRSQCCSTSEPNQTGSPSFSESMT